MFYTLDSDHPNFEENPTRLDLLANLFQLRRSHFIRAVGDIEQEAFEFIESAGHNFVAFLKRCLPVEPVFFEQIFGSALLG